MIGELAKSTVSGVVHALKLSMAMCHAERPFWQARLYDFLVHNEAKRVEKLRYMHRNPVVRGLVEKPQDWRWSSFRHYATGVEGVPVQVWRSSRGGRQRAVEDACRSTRGTRRKPGECRGLPSCPKARHLGQP
jgi:putative transposase